MTKVKVSTLRKKEEEDASLFISGPADLAEEDLAGSDDEQENDDERAHNNLIQDIGKLSKKKRMGAAPRSVRFSTREGAAEVKTGDILKRIGLPELEKAVRKVHTLATPLEKVTVKRAKRAAGFDKVACDSEKWAGLVHKRRKEDQLTFPLQQPEVKLHTALKEDDKMRTPLEKEVYALLQGAKLVEDKKETKEMKERRLAMSLEELKERNHLLWKERQQRRRIQRKAWMQNKNKSRKFHRLLRKDKLKQERAQLEELQKSNPEAALEKLEELERARVHERMTLRHKKSKWAQLQGLRVGRDETARAALKENLNMHQDLTAKRKLADSSDDEEDEEELKAKLESLRKERQEAIEAGMFDPSNPWTANLLHQVPERVQVTPESAIDDSFVNFKKFWEEVNRRRLIEKKAMEVVAEKQRQAEMSRKEKDDGAEDDDGDEDMEQTEENDEEEMEEPSDLVNGDTENTKCELTVDLKRKIAEAEDSSDDKVEIEDGNEELVKKIKGKKKQKKAKGNLDTSKDKKKLKKTKEDKGTEVKNDSKEIEKGKIEGKKNVTKKDKVKKKVKTKESGKEITSKDGKQKKTAGKCKEESGTDGKIEDVEDLEDHLVSIDNMFSQAELGLQKKLKRKLEKLGIDANAEKEWTVVKSKKKPKKSESSLPKIEEFEFTAKTLDNIDEGLVHARTLEDIEALRNRSEEGNELQKAVEILKTDGKTGEGNAESGKKNTRQTSVGEDSRSDKKTPSKTVQVDPSKFLQVDAKVLRAAMPDTISIGASLDDDEEDEEEDAEDVIQEAFADDYLVDEFRSAKKDAIEADKPKPLSLVLPGWGEWTGPNIKVSKRKQQRFKITMPKPPPRKDKKLHNVIYNEKADVHDNLRKAMVSELPYPFSRVKDFEASVRAPVGRMFVPEKHHKQLTAPPIISKMGTVIEPMTEEELLKDRRLQKGLEKKAEKVLAMKRKKPKGRKFGNGAKQQK
ncbi:U3 small nucleolar RNA-associated protein 14 homolog A [Palaemon carinicauda]|uniref:U3 small nucleolar RNA-associated protein 14 homolog A n=1 Tax=Palaemon carinicauda TaxID=392227 RepID=UPI0035B5C6EC